MFDSVLNMPVVKRLKCESNVKASISLVAKTEVSNKYRNGIIMQQIFNINNY